MCFLQGCFRVKTFVLCELILCVSYDFFQSRFVLKMWGWKILSFIDWFYVSLKVFLEVTHSDSYF